MSNKGVSRKTFRVWQAATLIAVVGIGSSRLGFAQTTSPLQPPLPIGSAYGTSGQIVNPPLTPPMPIGPAPYPTSYPMAYPVWYGQPIAPWPAYPPTAYPITPYWGRRPTPFDPSAPAYPQLRPFETQMYSKERGEVPSPIVPAPIGNLRLTVSASFLNRVIARSELKPGEVRDFILGADVTGHQTTETRLRLDLRPSADKMHGVFVLSGITQSQTTGVTPQAMVDVAGQQRFFAAKDLYFDGISFSTRHATLHVHANNQTLGATTPLSGTLFGGIADRIAYREAERRRPASEAIARDRVADRVYPEFDRNIDKQLATANDQLEGLVRPKLRAMNLMPSRQQISTTETYLSYSAQVAEELPTGSTRALENQVSKDGVCLLVHESLLNALVANSGLKGLKTTDQDIKALFAPYEIKSTDDDAQKPAGAIPLPGFEKNFVTNIDFDEIDPLKIQVEQGRAEVTLRAAFKPAGQDVVPPLVVTIQYETELLGDKILVTPGNVQVALQSKDESGAGSGVALQLIQQAIQSSLSKLQFDRALPANLWPYTGAVPQVSGIRSQDGWVAITIN